MEAVRKLYALAEAGDEYCPDIKLKFGVRMAIADTWGYRPPTSEEEINKLEAIKANLFSRFRKGGSRSYVCELLMQEYGPGGQIELFAFR